MLLCFEAVRVQTQQGKQVCVVLDNPVSVSYVKHILTDMTNDQFCLRWNNFQSSIITNLENLKCDEDLVDVTLTCEGKSVKAHKLILSACSSYFKNIFKENPCSHPVVILKGVTFVDISAVVSFMYQGEVHIAQDKLESFLRTAELLEVRGLADVPAPNVSDLDLKNHEHLDAVSEPAVQPKTSENLPPSSPNSTHSTQQYKSQVSPYGPPSSDHSYYGTAQSLQPTSPTIAYQMDSKTVQNSESASGPEGESAEGEELDTWTRQEKEWRVIPKQEPEENVSSGSLVLGKVSGSEEDVQQFDWHSLSASGSESSNQNVTPHDPGSQFIENMNSQMSYGATNQGTLVSEGHVGGGRDEELEEAHHDVELPVVGRFGRKPHQCPICHQVYINYQTMKRHYFNLHFPVKVNCEICRRTFNNKWYLRKHLARYHDRGTCIQCTLCNKIISNKSNLIKHMKIRHSSISTAEKCHQCGKIFKNKYSLKYHCYMYHRQIR